MIDDVLAAYGFIKYGTCNCAGYHTNKYRRGKYLIYHRIKRDEFKVKEAGSTIKNFSPVDELEKYLQAKVPHLRTGSEVQG